MANAVSRHSIWNLHVQRWLIPIALSALGIGYVYWESVLEDGHPLMSEETILGLMFLGLVSPLLAFATLTWAQQGAQYWEGANQELEARVAQRTAELQRAKEELAEKAKVLAQILAEERRVEEKTRAEIAGDLHDGVQQLIVGALYEIQSARETVSNPAIASARLGEVQNLLRRIETEMRSAIHNLHPVALDAQGLAPALRECISRFERVGCIKCEFTVGGKPRRYAPEVEVAAFRIAQEALNNVGAHAQAQNVRVDLNFRPQELALTVSDDGIGYDDNTIQSQARVHLGLIGMHERAASVGGKLKIESAVGEGTRVALRIPAE